MYSGMSGTDRVDCPQCQEVHILYRPFPIYLNSNMAPRLGGIKQKKFVIHPSTSM